MRTTTLIACLAALAVVAVSAPMADLSPVGEAQASTCLVSDDVVRDVECAARHALRCLEGPCPL